MQPARLIADNLGCRRGHRLLFRAVSFSLATGDALHVTGANGIGKSSLIRILAGLLRPFTGSAAHDGRIGLLDERSALDPHLPLEQALAFWSTIDENAAVPASLALDGLMDVPVRFLSTGQRKRAALARLAAQDAAIWLLDEPLNGLDSAAIEAAEAMIADHRVAGGIAVIASHQPIRLGRAETLSLADYAP